MIVLIVFLLVFFILLLGMAAFEFARYSLCCQQFQHCVDIAALGGAAGLASSQALDPATAQSAALNTAKWMMEQNYVLDTSLLGKTNWSTGSGIPTMPNVKNTANMNFTWVDPETGNPTAVVGDQKIFRVSGAYAYPPLVGSWIGLGNNTLGAVVAIGNGGGTMLDVVLCFDLSGSIDDSTMITMIERYSPAPGNTVYRIVASGTLYTASNETSSTGTGFNALYPYDMSAARYGTYSNARRGQTQNQRAPYASSGGGDTFTDVVVNLDENSTFAGGVYGGFAFPNVQTLVEASRGNLESVAIANAASVPYASWGVTPQTGYYRTYWEQAQTRRHPLYDAQASSANFFQIITNATNAHLGLVGFSSDENTSYSRNAIEPGASHIFPVPPVAGNIPTTTNVTCPIPYVQLDPTPGAAGNNLGAVSAYLPLPPTLPSTVVPQLTAYGSTDINGALNQAMNMLTRNAPAYYKDSLYWPTNQNRSRVGARRAIVLFTDGLPTINTGPLNGMDGSATATSAGQCSIPIYCIGLAQVASLVPGMNATLGTIATNSGGKLYVIPPGTGQAAALNRAFSDIARSLIALVR